MSGADDLARLTVTIDTANELFLSEEPKMVDVGGGVMRPTNAKVLADLATQMNGAQIYTSVALGLASTAQGSYFSVPSAESAEYLILYLNTGDAAVEKARYPSTAAVDALNERIGEDGYLGDDLFRLLDDKGALLGRVEKGASWDILLSALKTADGLEIYEYDTISGDVYDAVIVDAHGKILTVIGGNSEESVSTEIIQARGSQALLGDRLSTHLNNFGAPKGLSWGEWFLQEFRYRRRRILSGFTEQASIVFLGDSWTIGFSRPLEAILRAELGDAGVGWTGFGFSAGQPSQGNIRNSEAVTRVGTWTSTWAAAANSPDLCFASSSEVGASLSMTIDAGTTRVDLFAEGGAGIVRFRYAGAGWASVDLSALASGLQVIELHAPVAGKLEIEVVGGTPVLYGLNPRSSAKGVRAHDLGLSGSRSQQWAGASATQWVKGLEALAPNVVCVMLGTNDQIAYQAAQYKGYLQTLINRVRLAAPQADILLVAPCENGLGRANPMSSYALAMYELAVANRCCHANLQYVFGEKYEDYGHASARGWFREDKTHPDNDKGALVIVDALLRTLLK